MERTRFVTALFLGLFALAVLFWLPAPMLVTLMLVMAGMSAWEWGGLLGTDYRAPRLGMLVLSAGIGGLLMIGRMQAGIPLCAFLAITGGVWWCAFSVYLYYHLHQISGEFRHRRDSLWSAGAGLLVLIPGFGALICLTVEGQRFLLSALIFLVATTDSCAYLCGKRWGRHQMAPVISPGKTWEGAIGGLAGAVVTALIIALIAADDKGLFLWLGIGLMVAPFSMIGDLTVSYFKRRSGIKDTGRLLPGHGGMLDRIDGILGAVSVYMIALSMLGWNIL